MYEQSLVQAGLTEEMAQIYEIMLKTGAQTAGKLANKAGLKRGLTYKTLERLLEKQLVEKTEEDEKVAVFKAVHPLKLQDMVEARQNRAKNAQLAVDSVLGDLISDYNLQSGRPGVVSYEGVLGISKVYDEINAMKKDILLFRSAYDNDDPTLAALIVKQVAKQVARGINTRALTPMVAETPRSVIEADEKNLVKRRIIPRDKFLLDSQILVYGNKVAIISLKTKIIATIIDNPNIATTFRVLFEYIWLTGAKDHEAFTQKIETLANKNNAPA